MTAVLKSLCVISLIKFSCYSLAKAQYLFNSGTQETQYFNKDGSLRSEGIFVRFLRNALDLLTTTFPEHRLSRYCMIVSRELDNMEYRHTGKLAKHFRKLSKMYREDIKEEMIKYRQELDEPLTHRAEFLQAMNHVFTLRENLLLNDYVYDLRDYGNNDKLFIGEETGKVLNDVIVGAILKLSARDQRNLQKSLRKAIREYRSET